MSSNRTINNLLMPERVVRLRSPLIHQYMNQQINYIRNEEYIDNIKEGYNTRILSLNSRGLCPGQDNKIQMLIDSYNKYQINIILLYKTNIKWMTNYLDKMEKKIKSLGREIMLIGADTKSWGTIKKEYLPGELLTIIRGKCKALVQEDSIKIGYLGYWIVVKFKYTEKVVAIISLYRIPVSSSKGPLYSLT